MLLGALFIWFGVAMVIVGAEEFPAPFAVLWIVLGVGVIVAGLGRIVDRLPRKG